MAKTKTTDVSNEPVYGLPPIFVHEIAMMLPQAGEINWGMSGMGVDMLRRVTRGEGIKIGVIDTGVDRTHSLLTNVKDARDFTGSPRGAHDVHGHGTHVTGTIGATDPRIGVAPAAELYHGKGLGDSGSGGSSIIRAQDWLAEQGCSIISASLGGGGRWPEWEASAKRLAEAGVWLIYAGGNSGPNTPDTDWPGRSEYAINVAPLNMNLTPASFGSAGNKLDTSGPGVDIWSTRTGGGFTRMSGSSMATPFVAGVLGLYRSVLIRRGLPIPKVHELREKIVSMSTDTHTPGVDRRTGPGWLTPALLELDLTPLPPPVG